MARRRKKLRPGQREGKAIEPRRDVDLAYRRDLFQIVATLQDRAMSLAARIEKGLISEKQAREELEEMIKLIDEQRADKVAGKFVNNGFDTHANQLNYMFRQSFGIDVLGQINDIPSKRLLNTKISENINLITRMQRDHLDRIKSAVLANFRGDVPEDFSLIAKIMSIGNVSKSRARLIARDQTSKLNGALNQVRQTNLGIRKYRWQTSQDERVVGTPGGKYPSGTEKHGDHFERNRIIFKWDDPPPDGHPGFPIQCRCKAIPIINVKEIAAMKAQKNRRKAV